MRIELAGWSYEIGDISYYDWDLTNPGIDDVLLFLEDGSTFEKAPYVTDYYLKYQVWCVGAAGGRGGDASNVVKWLVETTEEVMPSAIWDDLVAAYISIAGSPTHIYTGNHLLGGALDRLLATSSIRKA